MYSTTPQLTPPTNFKTYAGQESASITLSWTYVRDATGYAIQRSSDIESITDFSTILIFSNGKTATFVDKSGLVNGNTYNYRIAAFDSRSTSTFSPFLPVTPQLTAPVDFKAIAGEKNASIALSWSPVTNATGYEIQRTSAINTMKKFSTIATISNGQTTTFLDNSSLANGETYEYKIVAFDSRLRSALPSVVSVTVPLTQPANCKAIKHPKSTMIVLSWSSVSHATSYEIQRSSLINGITNFSTIAIVSNRQITTYDDKSDLINGETYNYRVAAINDLSINPFSPVVVVTIPLSPPANFKALTGEESASIALSWTSVMNATGYDIQRSSGINNMRNFKTIATISDGRTTTFVDKSGLINRETYNYRIATFDSRLRSGFSSVVSAIPQLTAPTNFKAITGLECASTALSWTSVVNAAGYEIQRTRGINNMRNFKTIANIFNSQTTTFVDKSDLVNGETYNYRIAAFDSRSTSVFSSIISAIPQLTVPANFKALTGEESASIALTWSTAASATGYNIQRRSGINNMRNFSTIATMSNGQTTTFVDKADLVNGETYEYRIVAFDSQSTSMFSSIVSATPQLTAPASFKATTGEESATIVLSWSLVTNATGYEIQRICGINNMENFSTIATISNGQTMTFVDKSSLVNGETYNYRILAFDRRLKSAFSSIVPAIPQLTAPVSFMAITGEESASIILSWSLVTNATGFEIQRTSAINNMKNFSTIATISNGQTMTFVDKSSLVNGETYDYRILAFDIRLKSAFSSIVSAIPQLTAPVSFMAITGEESASIVLSWSPVTNATGYEIQRTFAINNTKNFSTIATISTGQTTTFMDKAGLMNGETYEYRIAAFDSRLKSAFSSVISAIPQLTAPASFKAFTGEESARIVLSWSPVTNATGYEIQRTFANNNTKNFSRIATISNGERTTFVDKSDLVTGETYNYRIVAFDSRLRSGFSSVVSAIPQLTAPVNFKAITGQKSATIVLSWSPVTKATGYQIQRRSAIKYMEEFKTIASISNGETTTFVDKSGLVNGEGYNYRIAAFDTRVISAFSSIIQGTAHICPPEKLLARQIRSSHAVLLSWTPDKEATGYNIKRCAEDGTDSPKIITTILDSSVDEYLDQGLADNCKYCYRITSKYNRDESIYESSVTISIASVNGSNSLKEFSRSDNDKSVGLSYRSNVTINIRKGDLTKENVDAIVVCSSSDVLRKAVLKAAGTTVETEYANGQTEDPSGAIIVTSPGQLLCQKIFFLPWKPNTDVCILKQSLQNFVFNAIQYAINYHFRSIAFPAVGCGKYGCPIDVVAETMISEAKNKLQISNYPMEIIFILQADRQDLYNAFITQKNKFDEQTQKELMVSYHYRLPSNWQRPATPDEICFTVPIATAEYNLTIDQFKATMKSYSPTIVRLERIQSERWYKQYKAHEEDFYKRLNKDTVRTLYHGCPEVSAKAIIKDGFNRSFAGVNGTVYGNGVYFATDANYSHSYAHVNSAGERCMFIVKVLIGKSIQGNSSMKVCPVGYDSTTNGTNIFVAYHDAQSYAEYLITYK